MKSSCVWNAYLPIGSASVSTADKVEEVTSDWLAARGCTESALRVLRALRTEVLPVVRSLTRKSFLSAKEPAQFSILVHDRSSGVPCPPEDHRAYLHLRLAFESKVTDKHVRGLLSKNWCYLTPVKPSTAELKVHESLDQQCAWYMSLLVANEKLSDLELLQLIRQHLHYFANMAQMRIQ